MAAALPVATYGSLVTVGVAVDVAVDVEIYLIESIVGLECRLGIDGILAGGSCQRQKNEKYSKQNAHNN